MVSGAWAKLAAVLWGVSCSAVIRFEIAVAGVTNDHGINVKVRHHPQA